VEYRGRERNERGNASFFESAYIGSANSASFASGSREHRDAIILRTSTVIAKASTREEGKDLL